MYKKLECCAIVVAGGSGSRLGGSVAKQFLMLAGKPVLHHSVDVFKKNPLIDHIVIVARSSDTQHVKSAFNCQNIEVIAGGATRQQSVHCAVKFLEAKGFNGLVIVHDAARPFVDNCAVEKILEAAFTHGAASVATAVTDTIKVVQNGVATQTLNRAELFAVQTPQAFKANILFDAHNTLQGLEGYDDCQLTEKMGIATKIVAGSPENIKITHEKDMAQAENILRTRGI